VKLRSTTNVRHDTKLEPGDVVTIALGKQVRKPTLELHGLRILHLDDAVVVVDKPAGLLSVGSQREKEKTAHRILNEYLKALTKSPLQQAFIVHRLDRDTSGLMMFARTESIQVTLQRNWKNTTKRYLAVVAGTPANSRGTLRDNLLENKSFKVHRVDHGGELAITHNRVLDKLGDKSLLELTLETGRKNQIRVQLAAAGHPIIGDRKYGVRTDFAKRLALHSCELNFHHPISGASMEFHSALPGHMRALIERRQVIRTK
jgi:23S rRNA pseudouridine1911/1915/1917 synthase